MKITINPVISERVVPSDKERQELLTPKGKTERKNIVDRMRIINEKTEDIVLLAGALTAVK